MSPAEPRIFISIACFSDPDVVDTVKDALAQASRPLRLTFGICLQALPDDRSYDELAGFHRFDWIGSLCLKPEDLSMRAQGAKLC